jgi:hypothetical protein
MANKSIVEIKPIIPTKYKPLQLDTIIRRIVAEEVVEVRTDYEKTTKTWKHKPIFVIQWNKDRTGATVGTDNDIYKFIDLGTDGPYPITPKRPGYPLRFNVPYRAKTRVMQIGSGSGGAGAKTVRAMAVMHPGIKARKFTKVILRAHRRAFQRRLEMEIKKQIR